ncbi:maleylpyruvate isomerase N-terminal domain-containing protein [Thalassiella azotivora]
MRADVLVPLELESAALAGAMAALTPQQRHRPTGCAPWDVSQLFGHVHVVLAWLPGMLDADVDRPATVSAAGYYRADGRFSPATDEQRIRLATDHAARFDDARSQAAAFTSLVEQVVHRAAAEPADRVVVTRHGDAMLLDDFLVTRVLEVAVHGLDLAAALDHDPWLTPTAGALLRRFLLPSATDPVPHLDDAALLAGLTGRRALASADRDAIDRAGGPRLHLGRPFG